jgi:hypothetical protein
MAKRIMGGKIKIVANRQAKSSNHSYDEHMFKQALNNMDTIYQLGMNIHLHSFGVEL